MYAICVLANIECIARTHPLLRICEPISNKNDSNNQQDTSLAPKEALLLARKSVYEIDHSLFMKMFSSTLLLRQKIRDREYCHILRVLL